MKKRVGILTSGGDCPGLNATIRGVAKALYARMGDNVEIVGTPKPAQVTVNGRACDTWSWNDGLLTARCGTFAVTQPVTIEIR